MSTYTHTYIYTCMCTYPTLQCASGVTYMSSVVSLTPPAQKKETNKINQRVVQVCPWRHVYMNSLVSLPPPK